MSQKNVEKVQAFAEEDVLARASGEFNSEAAIARQAELWTPRLSWMLPDFPRWTSRVCIGEQMPLATGGESGTPRGTPSDSSTNSSMRATEW